MKLRAAECWGPMLCPAGDRIDNGLVALECSVSAIQLPTEGYLVHSQSPSNGGMGLKSKYPLFKAMPGALGCPLQSRQLLAPPAVLGGLSLLLSCLLFIF